MIDEQFFLEIDRDSDVIHMDDAPVVDHKPNSKLCAAFNKMASATRKD